MNLEMVRRQVAEAENQALLAAWLHAESPRTTGGVTSPSSSLAHRNKEAAAALLAMEAQEDADRAR
jgi:HPt (histidine-containing phosphotransfer) domain-containing protein